MRGVATNKNAMQLWLKTNGAESSRGWLARWGRLGDFLLRSSAPMAPDRQ